MDGLTLFAAYWGVAVIFCLVSLGMTLKAVMIEKIPKHIRYFVVIQICVCANVLLVFLTIINSTRTTPYAELCRIASMIVICLMVILIPRAISSWPSITSFRGTTTVSTVIGGLLLIHYLVTGGIYFSTGFMRDELYFDGHRVLPAFLAFIALTLVQGYFAFFSLHSSRNNFLNAKTRKVLRVTAIGTFISLPILFVIDYLRWLFPFFFYLIPTEREVLVPIYLVFLSATCFRIPAIWQRWEVEPHSERQRMLPPVWNLSAREAEVTYHLEQGLPYKNIADNLSITLSTVQTHIKSIYRKSEVQSKIELKNALTLYRQNIASQKTNDSHQ